MGFHLQCPWLAHAHLMASFLGCQPDKMQGSAEASRVLCHLPPPGDSSAAHVALGADMSLHLLPVQRYASFWSILSISALQAPFAAGTYCSEHFLLSQVFCSEELSYFSFGATPGRLGPPMACQRWNPGQLYARPAPSWLCSHSGPCRCFWEDLQCHACLFWLELGLWCHGACLTRGTVFWSLV